MCSLLLVLNCTIWKHLLSSMHTVTRKYPVATMYDITNMCDVTRVYPIATMYDITSMCNVTRMYYVTNPFEGLHPPTWVQFSSAPRDDFSLPGGSLGSLILAQLHSPPLTVLENHLKEKKQV
ncbi:hypothetical protein TREES_T100003208 [Tupaia chinensis]|uniref:Uncharacterized protein n=1 Tax=Tupaia chinensis TaxID=246437 RepID=L9KET8_TUPCH|nr:hypothetical protein TREES_T100003208 [Tupaia chinensis]